MPILHKKKLYPWSNNIFGKSKVWSTFCRFLKSSFNICMKLKHCFIRKPFEMASLLIFLPIQKLMAIQMIQF